MSVFNIAIDGPASAGKSTIAKGVAKGLGIIYVDTGALYRALGLKTLRCSIAPEDSEAVEKMLPDTSITIGFVDGAQRVYLDGEDVSELIRTQEVAHAASVTSAYEAVRTKLLDLQRTIARENSSVMDGRDIGTHVLPEAQCKFYVTADERVRAMRRYLELKEKCALLGRTYEDILAEIKLRDERDSNREFAPLKQARDAILIDTTNMNIAEATDAVLRIVEDKRSEWK